MTSIPSLRPAGVLISFEGPEGSGKSTQIGLLEEKLRLFGREVTRLREPGGTEVGEQIRHLLKHSASGARLVPEAELLLFAASRAQLVRERVRPALEQGHVVLCDRYIDSSIVYQGISRGLPLGDVTAINCFAIGTALPQVTVLLDLPAEESLRRIADRVAEPADRIEAEGLELFRKVREGYLKLASQEIRRIRVIDALQPVEVVASAVWAAVSEKLR